MRNLDTAKLLLKKTLFEEGGQSTYFQSAPSVFFASSLHANQI